jgi:hypothetical protein
LKFPYTFLVLAVPCTGADYAAWAMKNPAGSWTKAAEAAVVESRLHATTPADVVKFCPNYKALGTNDRSKFWVGLLSAIARPESGFNPAARHVERTGDRFENPIISRGLLQISFGSAKASRYGCVAVQKAEDLEKAETNLACGARILATWVKQDGVIANSGRHESKGGARVWPVLWQRSNRLPAITSFTRQLPFCAASK